MQSDRHAKISERAYRIWLDEGRVHGRHDEHWYRAERELAEAEAAATMGDNAAPERRRRPAAGSGSAATPTQRRGDAPIASEAGPAEIGEALAELDEAAEAEQPSSRAASRRRQPAG